MFLFINMHVPSPACAAPVLPARPLHSQHPPGRAQPGLLVPPQTPRALNPQALMDGAKALTVEDP